MSSLEGKSVIVTGASSGIGFATAVMFASMGSNVTVCGRDIQRLEEAAKACDKARSKAGHSSSSKTISVAGDITEQSVIKDTVEKTLDAFGCLDVLVANHGALSSGNDRKLEDWTPECFDWTMDVNVKSVVSLIKEAVPHLEKSRGNVVCVSSARTTLQANVQLNYGLSKAAVDHMVGCLALQLGPRGIRVNSTNPTYVPTRVVLRGASDIVRSIYPIMLPMFRDETPLQGQVSGPDEQAEVILFLASDAARMVHGQCISVDGGLALKGNPFNFAPVVMKYMSALPKEGDTK